MSYQDAVDRIDMVTLAACAELCWHEEGRATCADCALSLSARMWDAIALVVEEHGGEVPRLARDHVAPQPS